MEPAAGTDFYVLAAGFVVIFPYCFHLFPSLYVNFDYVFYLTLYYFIKL